MTSPFAIVALLAPVVIASRAAAQTTVAAPTTSAAPPAATIPAPTPGADASVTPVAPAAVPPPVYTDPIPAVAPPTTGTTSAPSHGGLELTTLQVLRAKGVISEREYQSIVKDAAESTGDHALDANTVVLGRWTTMMYGFVEADSIYDSTQSFNDSAGGAVVAANGSYKAENGRTQFGARNSRFGFRTSAPEMNGIRASAQLEMDFLGDRSSPGNPAATAGSAVSDTEAQYYTNPLLRIRHMNLKLETPVVNILFGQYWDLFGWQNAYHPNTVEIQGIPGEIYSRTPQVRIWKSIEAGDLLIEIAVAAMRPPQRDSATPEMQGGLRLAYNGWKGVQTSGATGTTTAPLSIAVTGDWRKIKFQGLVDQTTVVDDSVTGTALAVDVFIPVIPADKRKGNALSITAEFATGKGIADLYTGLTGGVPYITAPVTAPVPPATTGKAISEPNLDAGIAILNPNGSLALVEWKSAIVGAQYYLPGVDGKVWIAGNLSYSKSPNMGSLVAGTALTPSTLRDHEVWWDANVFADVTDAVRLGAEFAQFKDSFVAGPDQTNNRLQFSAFYIF